jgi:integral membrane protein (TIGR01906 family)
LTVLTTAARWLFVLCLPPLLLTASIGGAVNWLGLYTYGFEKYDVGQPTGLADTELEKAARGLIGYFNSDEENISLSVEKDGKPFVLFNQREVAHLRDVKGLIRLDYLVLLGTLIYTMGYASFSLCRKNRRQLWWGMIWGNILTLVLMAALRLITLYNFDWFFRQFHLLSFTNELWQLDPARDYLIMLFPGGFWYDATQVCALAAGTMAVVLSGVAWGLSRRKVLS